MDLHVFVMEKCHQYRGELVPYPDHSEEIPGIGLVKFYLVGHNASHEFYLGTNGEKLFRGAQDWAQDCTEDAPFTYAEADPNNLGYMGHY
jgi:hypothetical protein